MQTVLISGVDGTIVNFEHVTRIYKQGGYIHISTRIMMR